MAGYSSKPLLSKLGIKDTSQVLLINPPSNYKEVLNLPKTVLVLKTPKENLEFIQIFAESEKTLKEQLELFKPYLSKTGQLWISWPKLSAKKKTDLNENIVRCIGLENNLVDVKVIAVDQVYSGLKFVYRVRDR